MRLPVLKDILQARQVLNGIVHFTPLEHSATISRLAGGDVYLKAENLQHTGSFKIRGAYNRLRGLTATERAAGVVAASAGNHAQGVSLAASLLGTRAIIFMPAGAPVAKVIATESYGGSVNLSAANFDEARLLARHWAESKGAVFIPAFDDPAIIAGQGTVGLEIGEKLPEVSQVLVPAGGGGLVAGVALALKCLRYRVRIIGVQVETASALARSFREGRKVNMPPAAGTLADGIAVGEPGDFTLELARHYVDEFVTVSEDEIATAVLLLLERGKLLVEGAGAVGVAALLAGKITAAQGPTVVVLSGGNLDVSWLARVIDRGLARADRLLRLRTWLSDRPGALSGLLRLVADCQANVLAVYHDRRGLSLPPNQAEVVLILEMRGQDHVNLLYQSLRAGGYDIQVE